MATPHKDDKRQSLIEATAKVGSAPFDDVLKICFQELKQWQDGGTDGYRNEIWQFLRAAANRAQKSVIGT
jgi:hypothetical protein